VLRTVGPAGLRSLNGFDHQADEFGHLVLPQAEFDERRRGPVHYRQLLGHPAEAECT